MKQFTGYTIDELPLEVRNKVIERYRNNGYMIPYAWEESSTEQIKEELREAGVYDIDIRWRGFYSQGDGLAFTGIVYHETGGEVLIRSCGRGLQVEFDYSWGVTEAEKMGFEQWYNNLCRQYYKRLEDEYYSFFDEEYIVDYLRINELYFTEQGNPIY